MIAIEFSMNKVDYKDKISHHIASISIHCLRKY